MGEILKRAEIVREARHWLGTPYHHHGRVHGVGVDCAMLLAEVYERAEAVPHIDPGAYPHDWHLHRSEELFVSWLKRVCARPVHTPAPGDIGCWRFGRTYSHGGIVVAVSDGQPLVVHAYIERGVILTRTDEEPLAGRPVTWWTLWGRH